jgi:cytoskeletal protein CcmA (bactofilin family)
LNQSPPFRHQLEIIKNFRGFLLFTTLFLEKVTLTTVTKPVFEKIISKNPEEARKHNAPSPAIQPAVSPASNLAASNPPTPSSKAPGGQRNILSNDVSITGSVRFTNDLLVDGKIDGEIASEGSLTVAENAVIKAEIKTKSVVIYGKVHGNIIATDRIEIKSGSEMVGDVKAATLSIESGAIFVGKSEVGTPSVQPKQGQSSSPASNGNAKKQPQNSSQQRAGVA